MINEHDIPNDTTEGPRNFIYSDACDGTVHIDLYDGATHIARRSLYRVAPDMTTYVFTLTPSERDLIVHWDALALWFTVNDTDTVKFALDPFLPPTRGDVVLYVRLFMVE